MTAAVTIDRGSDPQHSHVNQVVAAGQLSLRKTVRHHGTAFDSESESKGGFSCCDNYQRPSTVAAREDEKRANPCGSSPPAANCQPESPPVARRSRWHFVPCHSYLDRRQAMAKGREAAASRTCTRRLHLRTRGASSGGGARASRASGPTAAAGARASSAAPPIPNTCAPSPSSSAPRSGPDTFRPGRRRVPPPAPPAKMPRNWSRSSALTPPPTRLLSRRSTRPRTSTAASGRDPRSPT
jgi:hypothetical protein